MIRVRPRSRRPFAPAMLLAVAILLAGCDSGSDSDPPATAVPSSASAEQLPRLPPEWKPHVNRAAGLALGLPPGWKAANRDTATLVRTPERQVAVSITPDRSPEALELPLGEFATRTLAALPGYERPPRPEAPRPFEHRYKARSVSATARARGGAEQRITVIVLRRPELATFAIAVAANADQQGSRTPARLAERLVRTLRDRPVSGA